MARILLALLCGLSVVGPASALTVTLDPGSGSSLLEAKTFVEPPPFPHVVQASPAGIPESGSISTPDVSDIIPGIVNSKLDYEPRPKACSTSRWTGAPATSSWADTRRWIRATSRTTTCSWSSWT